MMNAIGYYIDHDPSPMIALFGKDAAAKETSTLKIDPMIEDMPCLSSKVSAKKSRDSSNTLFVKSFLGGYIRLVGSKAAGNVKSFPARIVFVEEPDDCDQDTSNQGDAITLVKDRNKTYPGAKTIIGGTPTIADASNIDREMDLSDDREFWVPCSDCGEFQTLKWDQVRWMKSKEPAHVVFGRHLPKTARYECEHCHALWDNTQKIANVKTGEWRANREFNGVAGFNLSEIYSPFPGSRLQDMAEKFLAAHVEQKSGKDGLMKAFWNTSLGKSWKAQGDRPQKSLISQRAVGYQRGAFIPMGGLLAVASVDVQHNRLEAWIRAFGDEEESWGFDHHILYGDPELSKVWQELDELHQRPIRHESGAYLRIVAMAIDSGYATHEVYNFCRMRQHRHVFAVKGMPESGKPILGKASPQDVNFRGRRIPRGVNLYPVGTDTAKKLIHRRLMKITAPGPGCMHYPEGLHDELFDQLVVESLVKTRTRSGKEIERFVKPAGKANELFDLEVYALAAAHYAGLTRINWLARRAAIMQAGLFAHDAQAADPVGAAAAAAEARVQTTASPVSAEADAAPPAPSAHLIVGGVSQARRRGMRSRGVQA